MEDNTDINEDIIKMFEPLFEALKPKEVIKEIFITENDDIDETFI